VVDVKPVKKLKKPVTLKQIKSDDRLKDMDLLRLGRLSVGQVKPEEWSIIMDMAK
jgi:predicted RNA-binding protein with PUA-like domain